MGSRSEVDKQKWRVTGMLREDDFTCSGSEKRLYARAEMARQTTGFDWRNAMRRMSWRKLLLAGLSSVGLANVGCALSPFSYPSSWYADTANDPPGSRQVEAHGKLWPPYPRPTGPKQHLVHTFHYAHYWPYPHNCEDEAYARNILDLQATNGWVSATTLHDYQFNSETHELTEGGRSHLIWVANSVPVQHRTVFVSAGNSSETARLRLENAEEFYREMGIPNPPPIIARVENFDGRPAVEVDRIRTLELNAIPRPRLFYIGSATAAQSGGGAAGGAGGPTGGAGATSTSGGSGAPGR